MQNNFDFVLGDQIAEDQELERLTECVVSDSWGIYVPQHFCQKYDLDWAPSEIKNKLKEDWQICLNGPEEEWYWDAWQEVLDNYKICHPSLGYFYRFEQNGDVFEIQKFYND